MRELVVSLRAGETVAAILAESMDRFGRDAMKRYRLLLSAAFKELAKNPDGGVSRQAVRTPAGFGLYHIRHSVRMTALPDRVHQPRHFVAFWFDDSQVVILDVLHERMDLPTRFAALVAGQGLPPPRG